MCFSALINVSCCSSLSTKITIVDFMLYEFLDQHRMFEAPLIDEIPNLKVSVYIACARG